MNPPERNCKTDINYDSNYTFNNVLSNNEDEDYIRVPQETVKKEVSNSNLHNKVNDRDNHRKNSENSMNKNSNSESSGHDSIIYTKDLNNMKNVIKLITPNKNNREIRFDTLESCTSSEFRAGLGYNEESFISQDNNDVGNLNIDIKNSNI